MSFSIRITCILSLYLSSFSTWYQNLVNKFYHILFLSTEEVDTLTTLVRSPRVDNLLNIFTILTSLVSNDFAVYKDSIVECMSFLSLPSYPWQLSLQRPPRQLAQAFRLFWSFLVFQDYSRSFSTFWHNSGQLSFMKIFSATFTSSRHQYLLLIIPATLVSNQPPCGLLCHIRLQSTINIFDLYSGHFPVGHNVDYSGTFVFNRSPISSIYLRSITLATLNQPSCRLFWPLHLRLSSLEGSTKGFLLDPCSCNSYPILAWLTSTSSLFRSVEGSRFIVPHVYLEISILRYIHIRRDPGSLQHISFIIISSTALLCQDNKSCLCISFFLIAWF